MNTQKAFTLIELLVVIAIIALLLAILGPTYRVVKEQASGAVCLADLGGIAKAWNIYPDDNDQKIVGGTISLTPEATWPSGIPAGPWVCTPQTEDGVSMHSGSTIEEKLIGIRRGTLYPYIEADDVYHCPGDRRFKDPPVEPGWGGVGGWRSYSITGGMFGVNPTGDWWIIPYKKYSDIKSPGDSYFIVEEMDGRGYNMGSWVIDPTGDQWVDPIAIWHNEKSTLGFADGHAEMHDWLDDTTLEMAENQTFYQYAHDSEDLRYMQRHYAYEKLQ